MTRTAAACVFGVVCDAVVLFAAPPLVRYSLVTAHSGTATITQLALLLCANLMLMALCFCGGAAWLYAFFQKIFRATQASVANDAVAMIRKSAVSSSTTPAN